jgi:hypothetical protein
MERLLDDTVVLREQGWHAAAENGLIDDVVAYTLVVRERAVELADRVVTDELPLTDLRAGLEWAGAHYWEAVGRLGVRFTEAGAADLQEATARQLARDAGILAIQLAGSSNRIKQHRADYFQRQRQAVRKYAIW